MNMLHKGFPFSTFSFIDVVSSVIDGKMTTWAGAKIKLFDDDDTYWSKALTSMMKLGEYVVRTQPDECGDTRFSPGMPVVQRSSGIFSTRFQLDSIGDKGAVITDDRLESTTTVGPLKLREDGVAFLPSDTVDNILDITGAPLNNNTLMSFFLCATLSNGRSSAAWTELRYITSEHVPEDSTGDDTQAVDFYEALVEWVREEYPKKYNTFYIGDVVVQNVPSQIMSGSYGGGPNSKIGIITEVNTKGELERYTISTVNGGQVKFSAWELTKLVDNNKENKESK